MIEVLIAEKESEVLEFKRSLSEWKEIVETVGAFSNTNGGIILVGVQDDGNIIGVNIGKRSLEDLSNKIKGNTDPRIFPNIYVEKAEGKDIIAVEVKKSDIKPVLAFGKVFNRVGKANQRVDFSEIKKMFLSSSKIYWDELPARDALIEDIDVSKVKNFLRKAKSERGLNADDSIPAKEALEKLNLIKNDHLTNAAILLFGKNPQEFFVQSELRCARFKGIKPVEFIDMKVFGGDLISQRDNAVTFIKEHIGLRAKIEGTERTERWEYPLEAIREAVTNAICHRDYELPCNVQIRIFDDRIEVWGCGPLPAPLTPDDLKKEHNSVPRNSLIAKCFFMVGYIEQWGTGTNRIISVCKEHGLPEPMFEESGGNFVVTIRKYRYISEEILGGLNDRQRRAVEYLKENKKITRQDYAKIFACSVRTAFNDLKGLTEKRIIDKKGKGKYTYYELH